MALYLSDLEIVVIIGVVLVVVYFIGSYWKHKKLTKYAHWFEDRFRDKARVKFRSFGHAGLGIKLEMKDRSDGFKEVYFTLSMGARENLMHYPLIFLTRGFDKISFWGVLEKPVKMNMSIVSSWNKGEIRKTEERSNIRKLSSEELDRIGYFLYASNTEAAKSFISRSKITERLKELKYVELVETDMTSSLVRVVSRLREESLTDLLSFLFYLGRVL